LASKFQFITELYSRTLTKLTGDYESWTGFLRAACYNYKCPFDEQVLIYAQRPNATAVLELEKWNRRFGRWVNAGATGIAVMDEAHGKGRLKHYFDITDTHATRISRPVPIWSMEPAYTEPVIETLEATFGTLPEKDNLPDAILSASRNAVADNVPDYLRDLLDCRDGSMLEELDMLNAEVTYRRALQSSVAYMLMTRLSLPAMAYLLPEDFPPYFRDRCVYLHEYTEVVNGELRLRAYRQRMQETLQENRTVLWQQYADFAQVLTNVSHELDSGYGADPLAEQRLIRYLRTVGVEADAAVFRESTGRLRVTIDSRYLRPLLELPDYLDKLSAALGVRLCMPEDSARGDSLLLLEGEPLAVSVGIASMRKKGEAVSGDRGTYFKTDAGQLCVILSDGMGCGESAADGSIGTVGMLEEFLRSGVSPALAMKLLNSAMLLRDGENWGYATVDLMCMNLFTGEADFYKYGAAPTYVKSGGALKKLRCTSFAPGLEQESGKAPDELHMHLKPGSVAVIASDGVVSDGQDLWLRRLLNDFEDGDMKTLAGSVVRAAIREYGRGDDMTALAVKVEVRS